MIFTSVIFIDPKVLVYSLQMDGATSAKDSNKRHGENPEDHHVSSTPSPDLYCLKGRKSKDGMK
jgi:hypothetical protein